MTSLLEQMVRRGASSLAQRVMKNEADRYGHSGTELSAVGPNPRAVNESSARFSRPQRRRQADGPQPCSPTNAEAIPEFEYSLPWFRRIVAETEASKGEKFMPESAEKEPGPRAGAVLAPARLPESE